MKERERLGMSRERERERARERGDERLMKRQKEADI